MFWINSYSQRNQRRRWLGKRKEPPIVVAVQQLAFKYEGQPRTEIGRYDFEEVLYGDPKRVDVYENPHTGTVCVYDIKTGEAGLSFARMRELAANVGKLYPATTQIVVTEVRPTR